MTSSIAGMIGLFGGACFGLMGWALGRRKAGKNRGIDELYELIWQKTRSYSWYITLATIYILFSLVIIGIEMSPAMIMGILLLVHVGSWASIGIVLTALYSVPEPILPSRIKISLWISIVFLIIFTVLSIFTKNWLFLLASLPPCVLVPLIELTRSGKTEV